MNKKKKKVSYEFHSRTLSLSVPDVFPFNINIIIIASGRPLLTIYIFIFPGIFSLSLFLDEKKVHYDAAW